MVTVELHAEYHYLLRCFWYFLSVFKGLEKEKPCHSALDKLLVGVDLASEPRKPQRRPAQPLASPCRRALQQRQDSPLEPWLSSSLRLQQECLKLQGSLHRPPRALQPHKVASALGLHRRAALLVEGLLLGKTSRKLEVN